MSKVATVTVPGGVVARVLGQDIQRSDCLSRSLGIGSVDVGIQALVLRMLIDDFSEGREWTLTPAEIDAYWQALRAGAKRANPDAGAMPGPVFDEAGLQKQLADAEAKLQAPDLPLLERLVLQAQITGFKRGLELKSAEALMAYQSLIPLRIEAALYEKYGGKVVARQISLQAAGAMFKLAEEAEAQGKLEFFDEQLKQTFWKRLRDDLAHPEVPLEGVDFSLPVWMQMSAHLPPSAGTAPVNAGANDAGMLERFAGVWQTKVTCQPARWQPTGGQFQVSEVTVPIFNGRALLGREHSQPNNSKSLWLMTFDEPTNRYRFWMFDSAGLQGGEWELRWNASTQTAIGRSTDAPANWSSQAKNHFPDADTNLVEVWMKDETQTLLMNTHSKKQRQPAAAGDAILAGWSKTDESPDRPAELERLAPLVGTWNAEIVIKPSVWTPAEVRTTGTITREWILNRRFVLDHTVLSNGDESRSVTSYDPGRREYRGWWFSSQGQHNASHGRWDAATQTFHFESPPQDGKTTRSRVHVIDADQLEWQTQVTDTDGKVYYDQQVTATRRSG